VGEVADETEADDDEDEEDNTIGLNDPVVQPNDD